MDLDSSLLPASLRTSTDDAVAWAEIQAKLQADPVLWAEVTKLLSTQPQSTDLYPVSMYPSAEWFEPTDVPASLKVSVLPGGRIMGRFFQWGECVIHMSSPGNCWAPPSSPTNYESFHQSDVTALASDGTMSVIKAGLLVPGHAHPTASQADAMQHYNDASLGRAVVRAYEDEHGGYIVGALTPSATYGDAALVQASALSGHWSWRERMITAAAGVLSGYDCLGPCLVARPGLPLKRTQVAAAYRQPVTASAGGHPDMLTDWTAADDCGCEGPDTMKPKDVFAALTYDARRERLRDVVRNHVLVTNAEGRQEGYLYVRDFTDSQVFFEIEDTDAGTQGLVGLNYTVDAQDQVAVSGEPFPVSVQYVASGQQVGTAGTSTSADSAMAAPVTAAIKTQDEVDAEAPVTQAQFSEFAERFTGIEGIVIQNELDKLNLEDLSEAREQLDQAAESDGDAGE